MFLTHFTVACCLPRVFTDLLARRHTSGTRRVKYRCVSESGDFKNVMNSKCFHLFSFSTYVQLEETWCDEKYQANGPAY